MLDFLFFTNTSFTSFPTFLFNKSPPWLDFLYWNKLPWNLEGSSGLYWVKLASLSAPVTRFSSKPQSRNFLGFEGHIPSNILFVTASISEAVSLFKNGIATSQKALLAMTLFSVMLKCYYSASILIQDPEIILRFLRTGLRVTKHKSTLHSFVLFSRYFGGFAIQQGTTLKLKIQPCTCNVQKSCQTKEMLQK